MSLIPSVALGVTSSYIGSLANQYITSGKVSYKKAAKEAVTDGTIDLVTFGMGKVFGKTIKSLTKNKATKQAVGITKEQLSPNSSFVKDIGKKAKSYLKDTFDNIKLSSKESIDSIKISNQNKQPLVMDLQLFGNKKTTSSNVTKGVSNSKVIYGELDSLGRQQELMLL